MKNLTWQNPEQLFVAQELINKVKSKCCGIKDKVKYFRLFASLLRFECESQCLLLWIVFCFSINDCLLYIADK